MEGDVGPEPPRAPAWRPVVAAITATGGGVLPAFLLAALAVQIRGDIPFGTGRLGAAVSGFFVVSTIASIPAGRLVERLGWQRSVVVTVAFSAGPMLAIAGFARQWWHLAAFLVVAGLGNACAQPAANLALVRAVSAGRQGVAFGIKQAAIPAATLLAGASVPALALTVGWRWAFVAAGALLLGAALAVPGTNGQAVAPAAGGRRQGVWSPPLIVLAVAAGVAALGVNNLGTFLVESSVAFGVAPGAAGALLAGAGAAGIASRIFAGWYADARPGDLLAAVIWMLLVTVTGYELLARGEAGLGMLLPGTLVASTAGFGWNGLYNLAVVRLHAEAPAAATGVTQTGLWAGGIVGPLVYAGLAEGFSYAAAWRACGLFVFLAMLCIVLARRLARGPAD